MASRSRSSGTTSPYGLVRRGSADGCCEVQPTAVVLGRDRADGTPGRGHGAAAAAGLADANARCGEQLSAIGMRRPETIRSLSSTRRQLLEFVDMARRQA